MTHARGLLQFNDYHRYTVDEHSLRVVEQLTSLQHDPGTPGEVYRSLKNKAHAAPGRADARPGQGLCRGPQRSRAAAGRADRRPPAACRSTRPKRSSSWCTSTCGCRTWPSSTTSTTTTSSCQFAVEVGSPEAAEDAVRADAGRPGRRRAGRAQRVEAAAADRPVSSTRCACWPATRPPTPPASGSASGATRSWRWPAGWTASAWWETQIVALPASCLFAGPPRAGRRRARPPPHSCRTATRSPGAGTCPSATPSNTRSARTRRSRPASSTS